MIVVVVVVVVFIARGLVSTNFDNGCDCDWHGRHGLDF